MALSRSQQSEIEQSLIHFMDFPEQPADFALKEAALMEALMGKVTKEHEFYWLGKCLRKPDHYLRGLEQQNPDNKMLTIGQVQEGILQHIAECLSSHKIPLKHWNQQAIISRLPEQNWQTAFVSQKMRVESGDTLWQLPTLSDKIYSQTFRIEESREEDEEEEEEEEEEEYQEEDNEEEMEYINLEEEGNDSGSEGSFYPYFQPRIQYHAYVDITVSLPAKTVSKTFSLGILRNNFGADEEAEENAYIENLLNTAATQAKLAATEVALEALKKQGQHFTKKQKKTLLAENAAQEIITNQYWFDLLMENKLQVSDMCYLGEETACVLTCPAIINLCKKAVLSFDIAKQLSPHTANIIRHPVYFPFVMNGIISIKQLAQISEVEAQWFTHSFLPHLIQCGKITFHMARSLPWHLNGFFKKDTWLTYFRNHRTDWSVFRSIRATHVPVLMEPSLIRLLVNDILTLSEVYELMRIHQHPDTTFFHIMVQGFAKRLYGFCVQRICHLNGHLDTIEIIDGEISAEGENCKAQPIHFRNWIFSELLDLLIDDFGQKTKTLRKENPRDPRIEKYTALTNLIVNEDRTLIDANTKWVQVFVKLCRYAEKNHSSTVSSGNFLGIFPRIKKAAPQDIDLRHMFEGLLAIEPICQIPIVPALTQRAQRR